MPQRRLFVRMRNGLGNAIRVLCTAMVFAHKTRRRVIVLEHKSKYAYKASRLFDLAAMGVDTMGEAEWVCIAPRTVAFIEEQMRLLDYYTQDSHDMHACTSDDLLIDSSRVFCTMSEWRDLDPATQQPIHLAERRAMYRTFRLRADLHDAWTCVRREQLTFPYVGVHIRRDDLQLYGISAECYPIDDYLAQMRSLTHTERRILCTDDRTLAHRLRHEMHHVEIPAIFKDGLEPFFDFLLLSHATHIVGTFGSSFSFEAALFGRRVRKLDTIGGARSSFGHMPYVAEATGSVVWAQVFFWVSLALIPAVAVLLWRLVHRSGQMARILAIVACIIALNLLVLLNFAWAPIQRACLGFDVLPRTITWPCDGNNRGE
jgi:hypothetical protein